MTSEPPIIEAYVPIPYPDAFRPYDPRFAEIAERIAQALRKAFPDGQVEHVGSTAVPGCAGKGVIDLMIVYPPGTLDQAAQAAEKLGFQPWESSFPPERPMKIGSYRAHGELYRVHLHILPEGYPEIEAQRVFLQRLRNDPQLLAEYVAVKQKALATGVQDGGEYNRAKEPFIRAAQGVEFPRY